MYYTKVVLFSILPLFRGLCWW